MFYFYPLPNTINILIIFIIITFAGSSTLPRNVGSRVAADADGQPHQKVANATSSTSLYDNVASGGAGTQTLGPAGGKFCLSEDIGPAQPTLKWF